MSDPRFESGCPNLCGLQPQRCDHCISELICDILHGKPKGLRRFSLIETCLNDCLRTTDEAVARVIMQMLNNGKLLEVKHRIVKASQ
jgi:hypothetical protein